MSKNIFIEKIQGSYQFKGDSLLVGSAVYGQDYETASQVTLPLKTMNRHGLIAGATIFLNNGPPSSFGNMKLFYMDMVNKLLKEANQNSETN